MSDLVLPGRITETGLELPETLGMDEWVRVGESLKLMSKSVQWWVGDWLAYGERRYGEEAFQALEKADQTLANWAWVCRRIERSRRREDVRFSHHAEVAPLPPEEQTEVLAEVEAENLTVGQTRELVRAKQQANAERDHGRPVTVETPECSSCGAAPDHWQRPPVGSKRPPQPGIHVDEGRLYLSFGPPGATGVDAIVPGRVIPVAPGVFLELDGNGGVWGLQVQGADEGALSKVADLVGAAGPEGVTQGVKR